MKRSLILACIACIASPAAAGCFPPPGLSIQQWYSVCGKEMEYGYSLGGAGRPSHDAFMQSMYRMYLSSRATYNPALAQQQQQLAGTMARNHNQYVTQMDQQAQARRDNFAAQQDANARQQLEEQNYINNQHCIWNESRTYCVKVPN